MPTRPPLYGNCFNIIADKLLLQSTCVRIITAFRGSNIYL